jgi:hypothetical protein
MAASRGGSIYLPSHLCLEQGVPARADEEEPPP